MKNIFQKMQNTLDHLRVLDETFSKEENFAADEKVDFELYTKSGKGLADSLGKLVADQQLYDKKNRQMILADFLEYIFLGRIYYSMRSKDDRENFIRAILNVVNMLMCYEAITVSTNLRRKVLKGLETEIRDIRREARYDELVRFSGKIGLKKGESDADDQMDRYFDTLLPKTAGGLWHELLVYVFLLRNDFGYIIPLLLTQRFIGLHDHIVPPDFLIIGKDKRIYGIEVGTKKEIQSGRFSLRTAIPTATIDTINSRSSDRCPICQKWIAFCPFVIQNYSDLTKAIERAEVRCLQKCDLYNPEEIASGKCLYTKYSRDNKRTLEHTHHLYSDRRHYHYSCVLNSISTAQRQKLIAAKDPIALKTHYPYYDGLDELRGKKIEESDESISDDGDAELPIPEM